MSAPDLSLLTKRRLGPMFVVQFFGAFNDTLLKFAMLFLATFTIYAAAPHKVELLATIAGGVFILPYFLFSALAGQFADKWDKARLVRAVKLAEIGIMTLALAGFALQSVPLLLTCLFLMGVHSTIFGPVKYSILPQHLAPNEVMGGTGLVEAGTFLAILSGQLLAGWIKPWEAGLVAIGIAILGFLTSFAVPAAPSANPGLRVERNVFKGTWQILAEARAGRGVWLSILGISWFFAVGTILLTDFPSLVSGTLGAGKSVVTLFLLVFSVAIALGSVAVNKLLGGQVSARFVPASALALSAFLIDLWIATRTFVVQTPHADVAAFLATPGSWHILIALVGIALSGGIFIVPLYAILQTRTAPGERSRIIAANNIVNAAVSVLLVLVCVGLVAAGTSIPGVVGAMGFATLSIALISCWLP